MVTWLSYPTLIFCLLILPAQATFAGEGAFRNGEIFPEPKPCQDSSFKEKSCQNSSLTEEAILKLQEESFKKADAFLQDKDFQEFQQQAVQNRDVVLNDTSFHKIVSELKEKSQSPSRMYEHSTLGELYIFVSFSLGEQALLNLALDAKRYGATLVLRGFIEESYQKTVQALQKVITVTGQGIIIEPELFTLFAVNAVPTFILATPFQLSAVERTQTPIHDRLQGHVSVQYALETFAREGSLSEEAKFLLKNEGER